MKIHIQNLIPAPIRPVTPADWAAAVARAGAGTHEITIGATPEEFEAGIKGAEAVVSVTGAMRTLKTKLTDSPSVKILYCLSAGLDSLAPFDWLPPGLHLMNNSGTHAEKGSEYVLMGLLMLANRMHVLAADQQAGTWVRRHGTSLAGKRVTMLGLGALGAASAALAKNLGMIVTGVRTRAEPHPECHKVVTLDELDSVLPETDYLAITLPLTPATRHVIDRRRLALLPKHAGLVNIGRGPLVEQAALCDALEAGTLDGAVLDVFEKEPVPAGDRIWSVPRLVMTPHMSADDPDSYIPRSLDIFLENLALYEKGEPMPNIFDIHRGY